MGIFSNNELVVGIDIGSHAVKICQLKRSSGNYSVIALGSAPLPEGAVEDGTLMEPESVSKVIAGLLKNLKIKNRKVGFSISGYSVIVKKVNLKAMDDALLEEHIMAEAEQYIPFDMEDVYLDYQDLKTSTDRNDRTDVMLVATKKEIVDEYLEMFDGLNLQPVVVDVDGFAFENSYECNFSKDENVALIDIGASKMHINVLSGGVSVVARDIIAGSGQITEQIQNVFDLDFEEAEKLKLGALPAEDRTAEIEDIFAATCTQWVLEVKKILDLYAANNPDQPLQKLILSGGGSKVAGLTEFLEKETGIEVDIFNPFTNMTSNRKKIDGDYLAAVGPEMAIAAGIALRSSAI
ncbi:type IV pilus assembly protein PilM [Desulforhopalus singaporensis]|uniref:Type IV pilus assembly protein PilM n=1 Tax=Desulforhopalus singaporensis TaxID=91360 RepID=A0A1H0SDR5_9BACT|nr:type IV pilus assembly protein PilM [Desulforhopalus singaporensis]SDP39913.1 type IV pilus assembly protein PilM [Desulforhopalus singaporensis]